MYIDYCDVTDEYSCIKDILNKPKRPTQTKSFLV